jgi:hypothetical protein
MAYLDNTVITVDAVLTKKGRERLSEGRGNFKITKFAVADDEIDYTLYNVAHPLGTNYYSNIIESMPVLEAIPDESQTMRFKLATLDQAGSSVPQISANNFDADNAITLTFIENDTGNSDSILIRPSTKFFDETEKYTLILFDEEAADVIAVGASSDQEALAATNTLGGRGTNLSTVLTKIGTQFTIDPKNVDTARNTKIRIFGNRSGATVTIPLTVNPATV